MATRRRCACARPMPSAVNADAAASGPTTTTDEQLFNAAAARCPASSQAEGARSGDARLTYGVPSYTQKERPAACAAVSACSRVA